MDLEISDSESQEAQGRVIKEKTVRKLTVTKACHFMGITRQAFYKRCVAEIHQTKKMNPYSVL